MPRSLAVIGAPSSAGAYSPGQEKAPAALRNAGLITFLRENGIDCTDLGDIESFRWRADQASPRAMNASYAARAARGVADLVEKAAAERRTALILGGDCTIELGTVAGVLSTTSKIGLVYFDLDGDMNTPETTRDGALDWMGVAHMLGLPGTLDQLSGIGPKAPMLAPEALMLFGADNIKPNEQAWIDELKIETVRAAAVAADPSGAARKALEWCAKFEKVLVHLDVDVIDFEDFPIAENTRRKRGLSLDQTMTALKVLLDAQNLAALTVCEVNPDHGLENGETVRVFAQRLAEAFSSEECLSPAALLGTTR
jgi:arginase